MVLEYLAEKIADCPDCDGKGNIYWNIDEDYDFEACECNPYGLILDEDGHVIWDSGTLFTTPEAR